MTFSRTLLLIAFFDNIFKVLFRNDDDYDYDYACYS